MPADHPIRKLRELVDGVLREMDGLFEVRHAKTGRPSIPPERPAEDCSAYSLLENPVNPTESVRSRLSEPAHRPHALQHLRGRQPTSLAATAVQAHLPDDQVAQFPCISCNDFALITKGQEISEELEDQCQTERILRTLTYAVVGDDFGQPVRVGDTYSDEARSAGV